MSLVPLSHLFLEYTLAPTKPVAFSVKIEGSGKPGISFSTESLRSEVIASLSLDRSALFTKNLYPNSLEPAGLETRSAIILVGEDEDMGSFINVQKDSS